jgi:signal recognition particle subunit SRP54
MGSMGSLMQMMPGMGKAMKGFDEGVADKEMSRIEAMILSMTPEERRNHKIINGSRRKRIARGSGTTVEQLNRMLDQFTSMRKMMKKFSNLGPGALGKGALRGMGGHFGSN